MKLKIENNKDYELFIRYCNEVINSDAPCSNCCEIRRCVLNNDFDGFMARYSPLNDLKYIDIEILDKREKECKEAFNLCKKCIFCYIDDLDNDYL